MKILRDQYNNPIPDNLKVLNDTTPSVWSEEDLEKIVQLDWYEDDGLIFVSEVDGLTDFLTDAVEYGLRDGTQKIDTCLHRWNYKDGFYHA